MENEDYMRDCFRASMSYDYLTARMICQALGIEINIDGDPQTASVRIRIRVPKEVSRSMDHNFLYERLTSPEVIPLTDFVVVNIDEI